MSHSGISYNFDPPVKKKNKKKSKNQQQTSPQPQPQKSTDALPKSQQPIPALDSKSISPTQHTFQEKMSTKTRPGLSRGALQSIDKLVAPGRNYCDCQGT